MEGESMIRVLIVEDDKELAWRHIYNKAFPTDDIEVTVGFCTMPNWDEVDLTDIDVVLMDGTVNKQDDGYDAVNKLRELRPDLKIVLSSYAPNYYMAMGAGADTTWTKKVGAEALDALRSLVRNLAA